MKQYWVRLHRKKKLGLVCFLLIIIFFLVQEIQPYFSNYIAYKKSDATPYIQINLPESKVKLSESVYPVEISEVPLEQVKPFAINDYNSPIFELSGVKYQITYKGTEISHLQLAPDKETIGFYIYPTQENDPLNGIALVLMSVKDKKFKEIREGDLKVSNWKWKNNSQFIIYINCGTGCHLAHVHSLNDGKLIAEYLDKEN